MRRLKTASGILLLVVFMLPVFVSAQQPPQVEGCPALLATALERADQACEGIRRNQACYGNILLTAEPQDNVDSFVFEQAGDIVNVADIRTLALSGMNVETEEWGVVLMQIQANLPDTLPGQNVTLLLFGDVQVENAVDPSADLPRLEVTALSVVNVRSHPSTDSPVVESLVTGEVAIAVGRDEDGDWVRIQLPQGGYGWVSADFVAPGGDLNTLAALDPDAPVYGPMQAFYFTGGIGDAQCAEAPDSGILIQTPEGVSRVNLNINGIDIELSSTAYVRSRPENEVGISLLEGSGIVDSGGTRQYVPAGAWVRVPLGDGEEAPGPPTYPIAYNFARVLTVPHQLLPREIEVAPPLTDDQIDDILSGED